MDIQGYIKELSELFGYIFSQVEFPDITPYIPYITSIVGAAVVLIIAMRIYNRKRAVREYLIDGVCIKITFTSDEKVGEQIRTLLKHIHEQMYLNSKSKLHFTLEILKKEHTAYFFIVIPEKVFTSFRETILKGYSFEIVTSEREKFIDQMGEEVRGITLELKKDFVFPVKLPSWKDNPINLSAHEWLFFQIVCRPRSTKWLRALDTYRNAVKKGRKPSGLTSGCCGGCFSVTIPFLSFLGDMITSSVHGGGTVSHGTEGQEDPQKKEILSLLDSKSSKYGFETSVRIFSRSVVKDRSYALLENTLSLVSNGDDEYNSLIVNKVVKKINRNTRSDLILAYLAKNCIDILQEKEISDIVHAMYRSTKTN